MWWAVHVARMEEGRSAFKILIGKPIGKRPLGRWEEIIRMNRYQYGNWVDWTQDWAYKCGIELPGSTSPVVSLWWTS